MKRKPSDDGRRSHEEVWKEGVDSDLHFLREGHIGLDKKTDAALELIAENTAITKEIGEKLDVLVEDTEMVVKGSRFVRKTGLGARIVGRFGERTADRLIRFGKVGLVILGVWYLFTKLLHGAGFSVAWEDFMRFITK